MKKRVSVLSVLALVVSLAAVMTGCREPKAGENTTTESDTQAAETVSETGLAGFLDDLREDLSEYSTVEHTTDEHFEEEFEALTLPSAVPASATTTRRAAASATTQAVHRETTTAFQFTSPSRSSTSTTKSASGSTTTTTKKNAAQNVDEQTSHSDTTSMTERITDSHVVNVSEATEIPRPNVTYLDKFVVNVLQSGSYTMQTELKTDGYAMPMTTYANGDNFELKMNFGSALAEMMGAPAVLGQSGQIRLITTGMNSSNPHVYFCWPGSYTELEGKGVDEIKELFMDTESERSMLSAMQFDSLVYCGVQTYQGYIVETYKMPEENLMYCFYFDSQGLAKWEIIDMSTNQVAETITVKLTAGVTDKNAFKPSGKKTSMEDMENMFGSIAG